MANGLCYIDLMDFNNNNIKELIAVCRNDYEHSYHLYIYSIERGQVSCVLDINGVSFTDYGGKSRYDSTPSASTVWIANDPEGNAAVISGRIDCYESKYNMYGYDGFNYRKLHYLYSGGNGADSYFVDNDERSSRWKYDTLMAEWSLKKNPDPLSYSWIQSETGFCLIDRNCQRIDLDFLKTMIGNTKKDVLAHLP